MTANVDERWPLQLLFMDRPREVIFCYDKVEVVRYTLPGGYWLYWVDKKGTCRVKQIY